MVKRKDMSQQCRKPKHMHKNSPPQLWMLIFRPDAPSVLAASGDEGKVAGPQSERLGISVFQPYRESRAVGSFRGSGTKNTVAN